MIFNFPDDGYALYDLTEYGITPTTIGFPTVIEWTIVIGIDKELGRSRVGTRCPRHGDGAGEILQTVVGLVVDRCASRALPHTGFKAAALDHETLDHTMEDKPIVMAGLDIGDKVIDCYRGPISIERNLDYTQISGYSDADVLGLWPGLFLTTAGEYASDQENNYESRVYDHGFLFSIFIMVCHSFAVTGMIESRFPR